MSLSYEHTARTWLTPPPRFPPFFQCKAEAPKRFLTPTFILKVGPPEPPPSLHRRECRISPSPKPLWILQVAFKTTRMSKIQKLRQSKKSGMNRKKRRMGISNQARRMSNHTASNEEVQKQPPFFLDLFFLQLRTGSGRFHIATLPTSFIPLHPSSQRVYSLSFTMPFRAEPACRRTVHLKNSNLYRIGIKKNLLEGEPPIWFLNSILHLGGFGVKPQPCWTLGVTGPQKDPGRSGSAPHIARVGAPFCEQELGAGV